MWKVLLSGQTWSGDLTNKRKDGTLYTEAATISPIKDQSGTIVSFVAVKRDITHEMALRDQLGQAAKWKAVGRLAGGIAHDFNNLLMVIRIVAQRVHDCPSDHDRLMESMEEVLKAVERGASLTGQLLAYSREQITSPVVLDLNTLIDSAAAMIRRIIGEDIEFDISLSESPWAVRADPDQIAQVLMNLCVNARDAMPQGGTLKIETANINIETGGKGAQSYVLPGEYMKLSVADSGVGMSKEIQAEIFEPFFTTKEVGKGTGLGLSMAFGTVKRSGGHIWVESDPGNGARFIIYLPRVELAVSQAAPIDATPSPRGTETLLIVEDDGSLRRGFCEFLSGLGYKTLAASSGEEALLLAREYGKIHLLLTDVVMPRMGGRELAHLLSGLRPELKVIYMSGYTDDAVLRHGILELQTTYLQKPFNLNALASKVRDALERVETTQ
jgi:signal transduction histidine kinase/ActR/RegA family two-component response regulator